MLHGRPFENVFFVAMLVLVTVAFFWVLGGYLTPMFWAVVLAVLFFPVQEWLITRFGGRRNLGAAVTFTLILATVIIPTGFIALAVGNEARLLVSRLQSGEIDPGAVLHWAESVAPQITEMLEGVGLDIGELRGRLSSAALTASQTIGGFAVAAGQGAVNLGIGFVVMLYVLFFALRDGERMLELVVRALPMGDDREDALIRKFAEVARATIKSTVVIGALQGLLGGIAFALLDIEGALFWGVVMGVLSLLPAVGASLVWGPAALIMLADERWGASLFLLVFGVGVISMVDNLLRPILVGRDTRIPDWLVLLSTLGGLSAFGLSGFVIGPLVAALFLTFWSLFEREHHADFQPGGPAWEGRVAVEVDATGAANAVDAAHAPEATPSPETGSSVDEEDRASETRRPD
ncbi:MAG: AI-2E family transporter [Pseudomonadales bacterium]|jgi:predicted PurR-regulated permease PerM|nr:AI-2E family transporter [Pseudomonadales bacterium]